MIEDGGLLALGLWSITTARVDTLVAWSLGQGAGVFLAGVVLQNTGWAPAVRP